MTPNPPTYTPPLAEPMNDTGTKAVTTSYQCSSSGLSSVQFPLWITSWYVVATLLKIGNRSLGDYGRLLFQESIPVPSPTPVPSKMQNTPVAPSWALALDKVYRL